MFNKVTLVGRISTDLELRYTGSNKAYCRFNLAVNRMNEGTDFIPVTVWGKPAENLVQYQNKGSLILIDGSISMSNYTDKDGKNLGYIESIQLVEKKNSPSYSENISVKENSDLYTVTKSDNSELENICWLIVKDGEIQKIVDASEINEFKLRKDVPEGVYTVLLCTDYDSTTHSYTQVSNAIEIII